MEERLNDVEYRLKSIELRIQNIERMYNDVKRPVMWYWDLFTSVLCFGKGIENRVVVRLESLNNIIF